jgi:hypothetical protein
MLKVILEFCCHNPIAKEEAWSGVAGASNKKQKRRGGQGTMRTHESFVSQYFNLGQFSLVFSPC